MSIIVDIEVILLKHRPNHSTSTYYLCVLDTSTVSLPTHTKMSIIQLGLAQKIKNLMSLLLWNMRIDTHTHKLICTHI